MPDETRIHQKKTAAKPRQEQKKTVSKPEQEQKKAASKPKQGHKSPVAAVSSAPKHASSRPEKKKGFWAKVVSIFHGEDR